MYHKMPVGKSPSSGVRKSSAGFADRDRGKDIPFRNNQAKSSGKKPLPGPFHVSDFFKMVVMKICRSILFVDTSVKIGIYFVGVIGVSMFTNLFPMPKTFLADSKNPLNLYFIKMGWGWTLTLVGTYVFLTSFVYCCRENAKIWQHGMRLLVGTFWWYMCTKSFNHVESVVGVCSQSSHEDRAACLQAGKRWFGYDISGHIFLEVHCLLIISEELKSFKEWKKLGILLNDEDLKDKRRISESEIQQAKMDYETFTPYIKIFVFLIAIIYVLFEFMLLVSTAYKFHSLSQKVLGLCTAIVCWFLSYRVIFRSRNPFPFVPNQVGESRLAFMKVD